MDLRLSTARAAILSCVWSFPVRGRCGRTVRCSVRALPDIRDAPFHPDIRGRVGGLRAACRGTGRSGARPAGACLWIDAARQDPPGHRRSGRLLQRRRRRRIPRTGSWRSRTRRSRVSSSTLTIRSNCSSPTSSHTCSISMRRGAGWRVLRRVFGRGELTFPHLFDGSYLIEGLATFYESRLTDGGRVRGSRFPRRCERGCSRRKARIWTKRNRIPAPGRSTVTTYSAVSFSIISPRGTEAETTPAWMARRAGSFRSILSRGAASAISSAAGASRRNGTTGSRLSAPRRCGCETGFGQLPPVWRRRRACVTWRTSRRFRACRPMDRRSRSWRPTRGASRWVCTSPIFGHASAANRPRGQPACVRVVARWPLDRLFAAGSGGQRALHSPTCSESRLHQGDHAPHSQGASCITGRSSSGPGGRGRAVRERSKPAGDSRSRVRKNRRPLPNFRRRSPGDRPAGRQMARGSPRCASHVGPRLDLVLLSADGRLLSNADRRSCPRRGPGVGRERAGGNSRLFFTSDRTGVRELYGLELEGDGTLVSI